MPTSTSTLYTNCDVGTLNEYFTNNATIIPAGIIYSKQSYARISVLRSCAAFLCRILFASVADISTKLCGAAVLQAHGFHGNYVSLTSLRFKSVGVFDKNIFLSIYLLLKDL